MFSFFAVLRFFVEDFELEEAERPLVFQWFFNGSSMVLHVSRQREGGVHSRVRVRLTLA